MKVVILAGGLGSRLAEETDIRPKPMVQIGDKPILWHIMKIYSHHGFHDFIVCLGYKGYMIKEYFANYFLHTSDVTIDVAENRIEVHRRTAEPWRITLVDTGIGTQTGGRIKRIIPYVENDKFFALTYGDGVADIDIAAEIAFHRSHGRQATMTVVRPQRRFGAVTVEGQRVTAFAEKTTHLEGWINGGFFLLSPEVGRYIAGDDTAWELEPVQSLARADQMQAYVHDGFWHPMDTISDRNFLDGEWKSGRAPWKLW